MAIRFEPDDLKEAPVETIATARYLYATTDVEQRHYASAIYLAGVAVESMLIAADRGRSRQRNTFVARGLVYLARVVRLLLPLLVLVIGCTDPAGGVNGGAGHNSGGTAGAAAAGGAGASGNTGTGGSAGTGSAGWPGSGGAGTSGASGGAGTSGASGGAGAAPASLDLHVATIFDNPPDLADWPITTTITDVEFHYNGADGVHVEFSKRDGVGRWPDVTPPGWTGPLQYTLGMAEYINGHWYASAAIQFWYGLDASGGNVALDNQVAKNWYYDARWGPMAGYQPATAELIGIFVVAGNLRGVTDGSQSPVMERSNVVLMPMPDVNGAKYTF